MFDVAKRRFFNVAANELLMSQRRSTFVAQKGEYLNVAKIENNETSL